MRGYQIVHEVLSGGRGRMGGPLAAGLGGLCKCPKCGLEMPHDRAVPCTDIKCPKCNVAMVRKNEVTEAAGRGRGVGRGPGAGLGRMGGIYRAGPGGMCVCSKCKTTIPKVAGVTCTSTKCPKCGTLMFRQGYTPPIAK